MGVNKSKAKNHLNMKYSITFLACLVGVSLSAPAIHKTPRPIELPETFAMEGDIMVGGISDEESDAVEDAAMAESVHTRMYVADSKCTFSVDQVLSHSSQIVSGILHRISYTMKADEPMCGVVTCNAHVWSQPWVSDTPKINSYKCE